LETLTAWDNFYVIAGSSAAALTGLMFVVVTLVASDRDQPTREGFATFSTPTVLHFCAAFLVSVTFAAPWHRLYEPAAILAAASLYGLGYLAGIIRRTIRQTAYQPDFSDWSWYAALPVVAYLAILAGSVLLLILPTFAMFVLGVSVVLLIFIGIHNAWDVVTYITLFRDIEDEEKRQASADEQTL
jgi:hypothetical protein